MDQTQVCHRCGSDKLGWRGKTRDGVRRFKCRDCGVFGQEIRKTKVAFSYTNNGQNVEINLDTHERIKSERDLIRALDIDTTVWEVDHFTVSKTEGYRKDRQVEWSVKNSVVEKGEVHDTGKLLIEPMFSVKVWLRRKTDELRATNLVAKLRLDAQKFAPRYPKLKYASHAKGLLYELEMPDLQLGRLVSEEEARHASSPELSVRNAVTAIDDLISHIKGMDIARILFPVGNDFFDTNNAAGTTAHGTVMQDDVRWQRVFDLGKEAVIRMIDKLAMIAPVDILVIPGNHDEEKIWYFGDTLKSWYHNCPNVTVDNRTAKRKYYVFGQCLIGLTHGYSEKMDTLAALMPSEEPILWAGSRHREWHLGHLHHKSDVVLKTKELNNGVVVRVLRSLATPSVWEFDRGLVGSLKATEGFLWDPVRGVIGQFTGFPTGGVS